MKKLKFVAAMVMVATMFVGTAALAYERPERPERPTYERPERPERPARPVYVRPARV